jgi:Spy/CpxP family protein refolding chaperone
LAQFGVFSGMKKPPFSLLTLVPALMLASLPVILADDNTTSSQTNLAAGPNDGTETGAQGERGERWKAAFAQLDLTDAQKEQIKQIRATTPKGKERRQQIMAVLTPDQKAKLVQMIQQYRSEKQDGGSTTNSPAN